MRANMLLNTTRSTGGVPLNSTVPCDDSLKDFHETMQQISTVFYLLLLIPGLLLNSTALWVLCRHLWKKTKFVIFMISLATADLVHILSLPLRIYYGFTHAWPFGNTVCMICFYLKYLNMYASIAFLVCISVQRYAFLLNPFSARRWRRRYDVLISIAVWVVVGAACSPFILMRSSTTTTSAPNIAVSFTQPPLSSTKQQLGTDNNKSDLTAHNRTCFKDLPLRRVSTHMALIMLTCNELFGFVIPLLSVGYCSICIAWSLNRKQNQDQQKSASLSPATRSRLQSITSNSHANKKQEKHVSDEKRRALRMVRSCLAVFLFCFSPYHINFIFYLMVSQDLVTHCATRLAVIQFHPVSLCLASLSCCLNPLLYYFLNAEFRMHLLRSSSVSSSILSSPVISPTEHPTQTRLLRMESGCSERVKAEFASSVA